MMARIRRFYRLSLRQFTQSPLEESPQWILPRQLERSAIRGTGFIREPEPAA